MNRQTTLAHNVSARPRRAGNRLARLALGGTMLAAGGSTIGCAGDTGRGALIGGGLGVAAGTAIGHQSGHAREGAFIGGLIGASSGAAIGAQRDLERERAARYEERYEYDDYDPYYDDRDVYYEPAPRQCGHHHRGPCGSRCGW